MPNGRRSGQSASRPGRPSGGGCAHQPDIDLALRIRAKKQACPCRSSLPPPATSPTSPPPTGSTPTRWSGAAFSVAGAPWDGPRRAFDGAAAVVIRSTWGYYRAADSFRDWTEATAAATRLFNPIGLVRWNLRKDYVGKLAAAGVRVPHTRFVACETEAIDRVFAETGWDRAVVKPATGASGYSVELVTREFGGDGGRQPRRRSARHGRAGAGVPARDRRGRAVADLFRRRLQPCRPQAPATGRVPGQFALRRRRATPRRRRTTWWSKGRRRCARCPKCHSMPGSTACYAMVS